ncbi:acyl-CoA dehydrogenase, partial [Lacticaseibacillus rhamnosus]
MDFAISAPLRALEHRIKDFVREEIIPYEQDARWTAHGPTDDLRRDLNARAKRAGVFAPHVSKEYRGLGLSHVGRAVAFTAAGYSILGPIALHCAAPDEGNMHLLEVIATEEQRERYLRPLATG